MKLRWLTLMGFMFSWMTLVWGQGEQAQIVSFNPIGTVKEVRQVRVRFSEAMTALGDPRDTINPFQIECPIKGTSKWEDATNWVYASKKICQAELRHIQVARRAKAPSRGNP